MKIFLKIFLSGLIVIATAAWSQKPNDCSNCEISNKLLSKIQQTQEAFQKVQAEHKKHNVKFGPTEERKKFELAQGEAYRFVCDDDKKSLNRPEKIALINFVLDYNQLNIDSDATFEVNSCFRAKVVAHKKKYYGLAREIDRQGELHRLVMMNTPTSLDYEKK